MEIFGNLFKRQAKVPSRVQNVSVLATLDSKTDRTRDNILTSMDWTGLIACQPLTAHVRRFCGLKFVESLSRAKPSWGTLFAREFVSSLTNTRNNITRNTRSSTSTRFHSISSWHTVRPATPRFSTLLLLITTRLNMYNAYSQHSQVQNKYVTIFFSYFRRQICLHRDMTVCFAVDTGSIRKALVKMRSAPLRCS
jgi:hypothetical protein